MRRTLIPDLRPSELHTNGEYMHLPESEPTYRPRFAICASKSVEGTTSPATSLSRMITLRSLTSCKRQGQRTKRKPNPEFLHAGRLLGVDILWPTLLVQARMLRASLGFMDSTKRHQAYTYALEAIIEDGLKRDFGSDYDAIHEHYLMLSPEHPYLEDAIVSRVNLYANWSGAERRRRIVNLLESLDPMYRWHYSHRLQTGDSDLLSLDEWDAGTDREPALDH